MKSGQTIQTGYIFIVIGVMMFSGGLFVLFQPDRFGATTTVDISRPPRSQYYHDPYVTQTEFEIIQSPAVLGSVIAALNLDEAWGKKYNYGRRLSDSAALRIIKNISM